jgi:hypothetical protein
VRRRPERNTRALLAALALCACTLSARAQPLDDGREHARSLAYSGLRAYAAHDYASASAQLEESFRLLPVPSLGLWSARALVKLGRLLQAEQRYRATAALPLGPDDPPVQGEARATAELEHAELGARIPSVEVQLIGAEAHEVVVTLDGAALPAEALGQRRRVDPGRHALVGTRAGERSEVSLTLSEGQHEQATLRFQPRLAPVAAATSTVGLPADDASAWRTAGWIGVGTGAGALVGAVLTYVIARDRYNGLERDGVCVDDRCRPGSALDRYYDVRRLHVATLITSGVLGAAGVTLLLLHPEPQDERAGLSVRLRLDASAASLDARF